MIKNKYSIIFIFICVLSINSKILTSASSILNDKSSYSHKNCIDGNYNTAWVEGNKSDGKNEWIKLDFGEEKHLSYLGIIPGYLKFNSKGTDLWTANNQVKKASIILSDSSTKNITFNHLPKPTQGPTDNNFALKAIHYFKIDKKTSFVKLKIDSVLLGEKYNDACISEIIPIFDSIPLSDTVKFNFINDPIFNFLICLGAPPFTVTFLNKTQAHCADDAEMSLFSFLQKHNSSTLYSNSDVFGILPGAQFVVSSQFDKYEVLQATEYRWGRRFDDVFMWYKNDSLLLNENKYLTNWQKLIPHNNKFEIINQKLSTQVKSKKEYFLNYFDSTNALYYSVDYLKLFNMDENTKFLKFATHIKINYQSNGNTNSIHIILLNKYDTC